MRPAIDTQKLLLARVWFKVSDATGLEPLGHNTALPKMLLILSFGKVVTDKCLN